MSSSLPPVHKTQNILFRLTSEVVLAVNYIHTENGNIKTKWAVLSQFAVGLIWFTYKYPRLVRSVNTPSGRDLIEFEFNDLSDFWTQNLNAKKTTFFCIKDLDFIP